MPPDASTRAISRSALLGATSRAGSTHTLNATGSAATTSSSDARATNVHTPRAGRATDAASSGMITVTRDGVGRSASELEIDEPGTLEDAERHDGEDGTRIGGPAQRRCRAREPHPHR